MALLVYMPLHFFLAQSISLKTGGLEVWKVAKDVVIILAAAAAGLIVWPEIINSKSRKLWLLTGVILVYLALHFAFLLFVDLDRDSSFLATLYNNRLTMLLVIGLAAGIYSRKTAKNTDLLIKIVVGISSLVAILGLIQLLLPNDFLVDLGYTIERGARAFFGIDSKEDLPRIISTVRDPNSLGAYLVITISLLVALFQKPRRNLKNISAWAAALIPLQAGALLFTFSRSAWLGMAVSLGFIAWHIPRLRAHFTPRNAVLLATFAILFSLAVYPSIKESYVIENVVFHSDESTTELGSTEKHLVYLRDRSIDVLHNPIGYGPGTAGIVSIRNPNKTVLTENYYVQIAYEVGIVGFLLFIGLNALVYDFLRKSPDNALRLALLASFWGMVVVNLLLHSWTNEVIVLWWLLAGYAIGLSKTFE